MKASGYLNQAKHEKNLTPMDKLKNFPNFKNSYSISLTYELSFLLKIALYSVKED